MIQKKTDPVSLLVRLSDGRERRCYLDQVRKRSVAVEIPPVVVEPEIVIPSVICQLIPQWLLLHRLMIR